MNPAFWDKILKKLNNEISEEEERALAKWLACSEEHVEQFQFVKSLWLANKTIPPQFDSRKAFSKLTEKIKTHNAITVNSKTS